MFAKPLGKNVTRRKILGIFGGLSLLTFIVIGAIAPPTTEKVKTVETTQSKKQYEVFRHEDNKLVENYWLLVTSEDKSKEKMEELANKFKTDNCKKDCNISLYDDKKAAELDLEYSKITDQDEASNWKKKNYIYVADHLIGYLMFGDGYYNDYPYRDWYYKELRGEK